MVNADGIVTERRSKVRSFFFDYTIDIDRPRAPQWSRCWREFVA